MNEKDNHLKSAELSIEQNANMIDGILNNAPLTPPVQDGGRLPDEKPLDRVKEPTQKKRNWELER